MHTKNPLKAELLSAAHADIVRKFGLGLGVICI